MQKFMGHWKSYNYYDRVHTFSACSFRCLNCLTISLSINNCLCNCSTTPSSLGSVKAKNSGKKHYTYDRLLQLHFFTAIGNKFLGHSRVFTRPIFHFKVHARQRFFQILFIFGSAEFKYYNFEKYFSTAFPATKT